MNNTLVNALLRCIPIALQLAGACTVITAVSLTDAVKDLLNQTRVIATIPHDKSSRIYLNKKQVEANIEKNCEQVFSACYIILGYLSAVIMASNPAAGILDAIVVAIEAFILWKIAKLISRKTAVKNAERLRSLPLGEQANGVIAFKKVDDNSVVR